MQPRPGSPSLVGSFEGVSARAGEGPLAPPSTREGEPTEAPTTRMAPVNRLLVGRSRRAHARFNLSCFSLWNVGAETRHDACGQARHWAKGAAARSGAGGRTTLHLRRPRPALHPTLPRPIHTCFSFTPPLLFAIGRGRRRSCVSCCACRGAHVCERAGILPAEPFRTGAQPGHRPPLPLTHIVFFMWSSFRCSSCTGRRAAEGTARREAVSRLLSPRLLDEARADRRAGARTTPPTFLIPPHTPFFPPPP